MRHKIAGSSSYSRSAIVRLRKVWILTAVLTIGGCATYRPLPLTSKAVPAGLRPPDMNEVRLRAAGFKHPILKSVPFDDRNGLSPDEAAILAVIANPTLRAVRDRREIASAQLLQAGILPNPRLSYDLETPVDGDTQDKVNAFGLGLDWDITALISRSARLDAAKAHAASVDLEVAWQEWQVAEAARLHTYRLIIAGKKLTAAKQAETAFQQLCAGVKRGVALGVKTAINLSAVEIGLQEARSGVLRAQSARDQERLALNRVLGLPAERLLLPEKDISSPFLKELPPVKTLAVDCENERLDLLALKLGYQSREARVRAAVRSRFPKINLGLTGGGDTDGLRTVGVGVSIGLPFFDRNQGRIAEEKATRKQLFDEYTARLFEARADIARIMLTIRATQRQIAGIDESLSVLKNLTGSYRRAADVGQIEVFFYYQAAASLYNKQIERMELEQKIIELGIALEIASGRYGLVSEPGRGTRRNEQVTGAEVSK